MLQQRRVSHRVSSLIRIACLTTALCSIWALADMPVAHAQNTNLSDHVGGYMLGDFEAQTTADLGGGPGFAAQGGALYNGPASAVPQLDPNGNPNGVWGDFGDIQPQYYT